MSDSKREMFPEKLKRLSDAVHQHAKWRKAGVSRTPSINELNEWAETFEDIYTSLSQLAPDADHSGMARDLNMLVHVYMREMFKGLDVYLAGKNHFDDEEKPMLKIQYGITLGDNVMFTLRGRKFVVWVPWKVEPLQELVAHHGLDLENELMKIVAEEMEAEIRANVSNPEELWESWIRLSGEPSQLLSFLSTDALDSQNK